MKFAFVSHGLPPSASVQSVMAYRLLNGLNPDNYCLIAQDYGESKDLPGDRLQGKHYYLSRWLNVTRGLRFSAVRSFNVMMRAVQIARIIRQERCDAVVACTSDFFDLPASCLASRLTGVKFYAYLFDYYSHMAAGYKGSESAHQVESVIMKKATGIIVTNEFLRDELRQRYGVEATVIHNPCDLSKYDAAPLYSGLLNGKGEIKIIYTGSIYEAHYDAFWNLLAAIELLRNWNVKLHIYSNQSRAKLDKNGIRGPVVIHEPVPASSIPDVQWQGDLLFLPLSSTAPYPEIIRTSSPGKLGEYLTSRRPILVHVPPGSFLAWYFQRYECGMVVTENDSSKLARALETLLLDADLRKRLVANAWERAHSDFGIPVSQKTFAKLMELNV